MLREPQALRRRKWRRLTGSLRECSALLKVLALSKRESFEPKLPAEDSLSPGYKLLWRSLWCLVTDCDGLRKSNIRLPAGWRPERHCPLAASALPPCTALICFPRGPGAAPAWLLQASLSEGKQRELI